MSARGINEERILKVLLAPHITEKSAMIGEAGNQYVFHVATDANKAEVKAAVEKLFEVKVDSVQISNVKGKAKNFGSQQGRRKDWKKAYVRVQAGQTINFGGGE